jgi:hypothetical protein
MAGGMPATAERSTVLSIATAWVKNSAVAALISAVASLAIYGMRHATGVADADRGLAGIAILFSFAIILSAFAGAAYGVLTGAVLQRIVPLLPVKAWIVLHVVMAVVAGVLGEVVLMLVRGAPSGNDTSWGEILLLGLIVGAILGGAIGGLEAHVLKKAALGASEWIVWSVVAFAVAMLFMAVADQAWERGGGFAGELENQIVAFLGYVIGSVVMLPALRRLRDPMLSRAGPHFD